MGCEDFIFLWVAQNCENIEFRGCGQVGCQRARRDCASSRLDGDLRIRVLFAIFITAKNSKYCESALNIDPSDASGTGNVISRPGSAPG